MRPPYHLAIQQYDAQGRGGEGGLGSDVEDIQFVGDDLDRRSRGVANCEIGGGEITIDHCEGKSVVPVLIPRCRGARRVFGGL